MTIDFNREAPGRYRAQAAKILESAQLSDPHLAQDFRSRLDSWRVDANETNILALQLEDLDVRVISDDYRPVRSRQYLPVNSSVDAGAETYAWARQQTAGQAKIITNLADDFPTVETSRNKETRQVVHIGAAYDWTVLDIARATYAGVPLPSTKGIAARERWEERLDEIAALGAADFGIPNGAINDPNVAVETPAAAGAFEGKTAQAMLNDLNKLARELFTDSLGIYEGGRLLLPLGEYARASQTRMSGDNSETVIQAFRTANPQVSSVDPWSRLQGAGAGGANRFMLYVQRPDVLELMISREFTQLPPQARNAAMRVNTLGSTFGTVIRRPLAVKYMDIASS